VTTPPPVPEPLARFAAAVFSEKDVVLLRPVETWTDPTTGKKQSRVVWKEVGHQIARRLFKDAGFIAWLLGVGEKERANLFFGVCPRFGGKAQYDKAWQIRTVRVLWADLDHCTAEEALRRCEAAGLPRPSIIVCSGNGVHLYWLLDEPYLIDDAGDPTPVLKEWAPRAEGEKRKPPREYIVDPQTQEKVYLRTKVDPRGHNPHLSPKAQHAQDVLAGIASKIGGDHTKDLARLLRLPCTLNRKDERNGKRPVPCELVECDPDCRYPFSAFEPFAEASPERAKAKEVVKVRLPVGTRLTPGRRNTLNNLINVSALADVGRRSEADFKLCCYAVREGLDREEVWGQVAEVGKFAEGGRRYFDLTWEKAQAEVRQQIYDRVRRGAAAREAGTHGNGTHATGTVNGAENGARDGDHAAGGGGRPPPGPADGGLPQIQGNERQLREVTADALAAVIAANDPPRLFQCGGLLTRLRIDPDTLAPRLEPLTDEALRGHLSRVADWYKIKHLKGHDIQSPDYPPADVAKDLASLPGWEGIPCLRAVVECPAYGRDGTLIDRPGYHPAAQLWYEPAPGLEMPPISGRPSREEIDRAKALLLVELYGDFPFEDDASKAHALAALLLPFVRQLIDGPTPLHLFDAPTEGTGKTLLANAIALVPTGRDLEAMAEGRDDEERRKRITATLKEGPTFVLLDNLSRVLDSGALASVLTARVWKDRILGVSKTAVLPNHAVWLASGNNTKLSRELIRRTASCRLDAKVDNPCERTGFRHPNLLAWAREHRGELVWAALTLCQAWVAAGRPPGTQTLGMFESWAATLGGILDVAGVPGLLGNARKFRAAAADQADEWRAFVAAWWNEHGETPVGVRELFALATCQQLLDRVLGDKGERSQRTRLGVALGKVVDRVFGEHQLLRIEDDNSGRAQYRLRPVGGQGAGPPTAPPGEDTEEWTA
jgi:hypothetical protein